MIYITFLCAGLYALGLYPEELDAENFNFQLPARTKIQHMYQKFLKEGNRNHRFLWCPARQQLLDSAFSNIIE